MHIDQDHSFEVSRWLEIVENMFARRLSKIRIKHDNDNRVPMNAVLIDFAKASRKIFFQILFAIIYLFLQNVIKTARNPVWLEIDSPNGSHSVRNTYSTNVQSFDYLLKGFDGIISFTICFNYFQ